MVVSLDPEEIIFDKEKNSDSDIINEFRPNLSPDQMFRLGSFGGTYWRKIKSQITGKTHFNHHRKFLAKGWWKGIPSEHLTTPWDEYDININKYKVKCGSTLEFWEKKNWIEEQDPYGWVEWYCNFYAGRRSKDDERQIKRWLKFAGPKGRFKNNLINKIKKAKTTYDDYSVSPVIRQSLQHWGYQITPNDLK